MTPGSPQAHTGPGNLPHAVITLQRHDTTASNSHARMFRFVIGAWLSLVEHLVRDQGVGGSNPLAPIYKALSLQLLAALVAVGVFSCGTAV